MLKPKKIASPGRLCAVCGKPGGSGQTVALRALGYGQSGSGILYAHGNCVPAARRKHAATFERWWRCRDQPDDARMVREAGAAGLVLEAGGLLVLTDAGKALRRKGEALRSVAVS